MSHILKTKRIISKRKTIDAFFKKKDVSNSEIRTPVAVETNVDISMSVEHPSKYSRIQFEEIDRDPGSRRQIYEKEIAGNFTIEMIMDEFYSMKNRR